jgi:tetratricopeptide (TPR) repeat protein
MEAIQQKLAVLDKKSETLMQEGKYLESFEVLEEALEVRRNFFGDTSDEYYKTSEKLCELCNMLSMIFLQKEKFDATLEFLKKGEALAQNSLELRAVTFNNMACYYRRIGKLRIALKYLEDAISIEVRLDKTKTLADSYLNICAVHSQLGKHDVAMTQIMKSIILLQDEILDYTMASKNGSDPRKDADSKKQFEDRVAVLAIAYHNLGVEHEYLKQYDEAISTYRKAVNFATAHLGEQSQVVKNLQNVLETAMDQIEENKQKTQQRKGPTPSNQGSTYGSTTSARYTKPGSAGYSTTKGGTRVDNKNQGYKSTYAYKSHPYAPEQNSASTGFSPNKNPRAGGKQSSSRNQDESHEGIDSRIHNAIEENTKEETFNEDR